MPPRTPLQQIPSLRARQRKAEEEGAWSVKFEEIHHCISRPNHKLGAVEALVEAGTRLDFLSEQTIEVARVESQLPEAYALSKDDLQFKKIVHRIILETSDDRLKAEYVKAVSLFDEKLVESLGYIVPTCLVE